VASRFLNTMTHPVPTSVKSPPPLSAEDDVDEKVDDPAHSECEVVYEVCESGGCGGETW